MLMLLAAVPAASGGALVPLPIATSVASAAGVAVAFGGCRLTPLRGRSATVCSSVRSASGVALSSALSARSLTPSGYTFDQAAFATARTCANAYNGRVEGDRERWNAKWRERAGELETEAAVLREHAELIPRRGKAIDIAGGAGRNAIWLARRGLDVTLADVSDVALEKAERRASGSGLRLKCMHVDLDGELPFAPLFDVVLVFNYLNRARRDAYAALLVDEGVLVAVQPTVTNLERHASPRRDYLVEPGELAAWVRELGMEILASREGWTDEGRHEALVIARRTARVEAESPLEESGPNSGPYR
jgi:hypothetical protein